DLTRSAPRAQSEKARIVSLVPAITEMFFAIGAGPQVVGVGSFDQFPPDVAKLPRLGALLDPDTERILSLRPTLAAIYGSQTDLQAQLTRAGIRAYVYRHGGIETIYRTMRELGTATARESQAERLVRDLQARIATIRTRVRDRPKPKVLLVISRQPGTLREIYVSGGVGFLHEMLEIAGGRNVFADVARESAQPSQETILARAPDIVVEVHAEGMFKTSNVENEKAVWTPLSSLPAVRNNRVHVLLGQHLVVPGPRFAAGAEALARTIHPTAFR
ncbi:MAG: ABC transporter substrate-binding protein, partial [Vicinamibacterales bacterium]